MFGSHIDKNGDMIPLSAKFSPAIKNAQYKIKNPKLIVVLRAKFPRRAMIPRGAPIRINTNTIAANQTIASSENGFIAGPVTINTGVTLTVNGTFTVV